MIKSVTIEVTVDVICDVDEDWDEAGRVSQSLNIHMVKLGNTDITKALEQTKFDFNIIVGEILDEL